MNKLIKRSLLSLVAIFILTSAVFATTKPRFVKELPYDVGLSKEPKVYKIKGISIHNCASAIATTSMLSVMVTENNGMLIKDACINYNNAWQEKIIAKIVQWYRKATYFEDVFPLFREVLENRYDFLVDLNYALDRKIMDY